MTLARHISDLLFDHDCVIVPGFGGFVTTVSPAFHHPVKHLFYPPYKKIAFNRNLQNNDGLLANAIATASGISFGEAMNTINSEVAVWQKQLQENKRFTIEKTGTFYFDAKQNLQFDQDMNINYLPDSFGLAPVHQRPIHRENLQQRVEKKLQDRPPVKLPSRIPVGRIAAVSAAVFVLAVSIWASYQTDLFKNIPQEYSSLNPFAKDREQVESASPATNPPFETNNVTPAEVLPAEATQPDIPPVVSVSPPDTTSVKSIDVPEAPAVSSPGNFLIIGGCFRYHDNAEKLVASLRGKGFSNAAISGTTPGGLHMVSFGGFSTREEAVVELARVQSEQEPKAWLFEN